MTGRVKTIKADRGFGFLETPDGDLFFHLRQMFQPERFGEHLVGYRATFDLSSNDGKRCAINVALED